MNFKAIIILSLLIVTSLGFLKKHKVQNNLSSKEGDPIAQLEDEIFEKSENYRKNKLERLKALNALAEKEAQQIGINDDFGKHTNFYNWADQTPYEHFTEISVKMQIDEFNPAEISNYAITILEAIKNQKDWYLSHEETYGGIKIYTTTDKPNIYIIVIHMLKPLDYYRSCKDSLFFEDYAEFINIYDKEKNVTYSNVACIQTEQDGGWTLLMDSNKKERESSIIDIPDMGFDYTELFWKKKRTFKFDYTSTLDTNWDFLGFCFPINMIQIDNSYYYISEDIPTGIPGVEGSRVRGTGFDDLTTKVDIKYYKLSDVNIITESDMCLFSSTERPQFCADEFIMPLPGKATQFTDVESLTKLDNSDNEYTYKFEFYVR